MQRRFIPRKRSNEKRFRVNDAIRIPEVLVIDQDGNNIGKMLIEQARALAQEAELDLIEVAPLSRPPVCRIMNLGKWQYELAHKTKKQKILDTKVVRITFKIGEHDRQIRLAQTRKFLDKGHKVKIDMRLRGREKAHPEQGRLIVDKFMEDLGPSINREQNVTMQNMSVSALVSKKK